MLTMSTLHNMSFVTVAGRRTHGGCCGATIFRVIWALHTYIHTYIHTCIHTCIPIGTDMRVQLFCIFHIFVYMYRWHGRCCSCMYIRMYVSMWVCMHAYVCVCVCIYIYTYRCMRTHTHIYIYVIYRCTCIYIYMLPPPPKAHRFHDFRHILARYCSASTLRRH